MKILTCNIRVSHAQDGTNNWAFRKDLCAEIILAQAPDIICFQEMRKDQFDDLSLKLPGYHSYGMADTPTGRSTVNCIFYRADQYTKISAGGFWLSETPHIAGSQSWDSSCIRIANWIRLEDRVTRAEFRVVNTHLDHISQPARENQARLIVEDALAYPENYPQILTGDMNCDFTNAAIENFKAGGWHDTYCAVHGTENPGLTYHAFKGDQFDALDIGKMDWIFTRGAVQTTDATVIADSAEGRFPSDHYFISASLTIEATTHPS